MHMHKRAISALLISAILMLVMPSSSAAQDAATGTIRGTLLDSNGQALVGYKVKVVDASGAVYEAPPTGPDGKYEISNLPEGTYNYQIFDPSGKVVPVKIPPVNLQAGTAVSQPIAIVPRGGGKGPLIAWLVGGGVVVAAVAIAAGNDDDDEDDDGGGQMTPSSPE